MKNLNAKGFTLLEVLTATSILVVVSFFVLKISAQVLEAWGRGSEKLSRGIEGHFILDIMEEDLEMAFPYFWVYDTNTKEFDKEKKRFCFCAKGRDGKMKAIAYAIAPNVDGEGHGLYRYETEIYSEVWDIRKLGQLLCPAEIPMKEIGAKENLVTEDIEDFSVRFFCKDDDGKIEWTQDGRFDGLPICVEVTILSRNGEKLRRKVSLIVVRL